MGLAGQVLVLHRAILRATVVENQAGQLQVADRATRNGNTSGAVSEREREIVAVAPTMILGAASQVGDVEKAGRLRLVGLLYEQRGSICIPIDKNSYLIISTLSENFLDVLKTLEHALPRIMQGQNFAPTSITIRSATEADQAVRSFFAHVKLCEPRSVHFEDAMLDAAEQSWHISGTYRPIHAVRSKRYYIELDARTGSITKFQSPN